MNTFFFVTANSFHRLPQWRKKMHAMTRFFIALKTMNRGTREFIASFVRRRTGSQESSPNGGANKYKYSGS